MAAVRYPEPAGHIGRMAWHSTAQHDTALHCMAILAHVQMVQATAAAF
jgi:hypothetical protein